MCRAVFPKSTPLLILHVQAQQMIHKDFCIKVFKSDSIWLTSEKGSPVKATEEQLTLEFILCSSSLTTEPPYPWVDIGVIIRMSHTLKYVNFLVNITFKPHTQKERIKSRILSWILLFSLQILLKCCRMIALWKNDHLEFLATRATQTETIERYQSSVTLNEGKHLLFLWGTKTDSLN